MYRCQSTGTCSKQLWSLLLPRHEPVQLAKSIPFWTRDWTWWHPRVFVNAYHSVILLELLCSTYWQENSDCIGSCSFWRFYYERITKSYFVVYLYWAMIFLLTVFCSLVSFRVIWSIYCTIQVALLFPLSASSNLSLREHFFMAKYGNKTGQSSQSSEWNSQVFWLLDIESIWKLLISHR